LNIQAFMFAFAFRGSSAVLWAIMFVGVTHGSNALLKAFVFALATYGSVRFCGSSFYLCKSWSNALLWTFMFTCATHGPMHFCTASHPWNCGPSYSPVQLTDQCTSVGLHVATSRSSSWWSLDV